jgi:Type IV secretion system pilin
VSCLVTLTWSGVQWATAKKEKAKRARAKGRIKWALIGLVAAFLAYIILNIILNLHGLDIATPLEPVMIQ